MGIPYAEVIGDPIAHSKSPLIHKFWLEKLGIEGDYRATRTGVRDLAAYFHDRRSDPDWLGCSVTMPLKHAALDYVDHVDDLANDCAAANCVFRQEDQLIATNTDIWGLTATLGLFEAKDPVIVLGTGGAARSALKMLASFNAVEVDVVARDTEAADNLLELFDLEGSTFRLGQKIDVRFPMMLINATPLGMTDFPPMPPTVLDLIGQMDASGVVLDMVYDPAETVLVKTARAQGKNAANGVSMLVNQARQAFEFWYGVRPPLELNDELARLVMR